MFKIYTTAFFLICCLILFSCSGSSSGKSESNADSTATTAEVDDNPKRTLSPFTVDPNEELHPQNLIDEFLRWKFAWQEKDVKVIAWLAGGTSGEAAKRFSNADNPGVITLAVTFKPEEFEKTKARGGKASHVILMGKIFDGGDVLAMDQTIFYGDHTGEVPSGAEIDPSQLETGGPFNPLDLRKSIEAWTGKEVTVKGFCTIPANGNVITMKKGDTELIRITTKEAIKSKSPQSGEMVVKGIVNDYDGRSEVLKMDSGEIK